MTERKIATARLTHWNGLDLRQLCEDNGIEFTDELAENLAEYLSHQRKGARYNKIRQEAT